MEINLLFGNGCPDFNEIRHGDSRNIGEFSFRVWIIYTHNGLVHSFPKFWILNKREIEISPQFRNS